MHDLQGMIFDFDGTLAELNIDFSVMKERIAELACLFLDREVKPDSLPALEWIEELSLEMGRSLPESEVLEFQSRCRFRIIAMEMEAAERGRLFPFAEELLERLRRSGIRTGIITRNCTAAVKAVFPGVHQACDAFLARDSVSRVKPHPEHALKAAGMLGIAPERCLLVGDHRLDIQCAISAGMRSGGVGSGSFGIEDLARSGADHVAPDAAALVAMLQQEPVRGREG
jgi:phosphoglycolate phosphatase